MQDLRVEFLSTGRVRMREAMSGQPISNKNRALRILRSLTGPWTPWLPIGVFIIRHRDGPILIDTGASPECVKRGYFPAAGCFNSLFNELEVLQADGIVAQLAAKGIKPKELQAVVLTHLHYDHAGGLEDIVAQAPEVPVYIGSAHWDAFGKNPTYAAFQGCAPNHWPKNFNLQLLNFDEEAVGPWRRSARITQDDQVIAVETPGHVPGHISIVISSEGESRDTEDIFLITGDATYNLDVLEKGEPDGINDDPLTAFQSLELIKVFCKQKRVVVIPSHDVNAPKILEEKRQYRPKE